VNQKSRTYSKIKKWKIHLAKIARYLIYQPISYNPELMVKSGALGQA